MQRVLEEGGVGRWRRWRVAGECRERRQRRVRGLGLVEAGLLVLVMMLAVAPALTAGTGRLSYPISGQCMR